MSTRFAICRRSFGSAVFSPRSELIVAGHVGDHYGRPVRRDLAVYRAANARRRRMPPGPGLAGSSSHFAPEAVMLDRPHDGIRCGEPLQAASRVSLSRGFSTRPLPGRELGRKIAATRIGGEPKHVRLLG
jgi:hypothetical protein